ncbi:MAG: hypothetical protein RIS47_2045 [Bacteroidota bacterium]
MWPGRQAYGLPRTPPYNTAVPCLFSGGRPRPDAKIPEIQNTPMFVEYPNHPNTRYLIGVEARSQRRGWARSTHLPRIALVMQLLALYPKSDT